MAVIDEIDEMLRENYNPDLNKSAFEIITIHFDPKIKCWIKQLQKAGRTAGMSQFGRRAILEELRLQVEYLDKAIS